LDLRRRCRQQGRAAILLSKAVLELFELRKVCVGMFKLDLVVSRA
jgi:hypothetical protein